jgi:hypothetical protein
VIACGAALLASACAAAPRPLEKTERVPLPDGRSVVVSILVQTEHAREADRFGNAARSALAVCAEWNGPYAQPALTLVDPAWRSTVADTTGTVVLDRVRWWTARTSMAVELATARAISRRCLSDGAHHDALPAWFLAGLAEMLARRAVAPLFEANNQAPGYAFLEARYFDSFVPRFIRIRVSSATDGGPVDIYRRRPDVEFAGTSATGATDARLIGKTVLALGTLERWLGRPVFDEALAAFLRLSRDRSVTLADFERAVSDVSAQDLSWFFDETFRKAGVFDYGVERLSTVKDGDAYTTTIVARRYGNADFTGASAPRVDGFESGRGIALRVVFADTQQVTAYWDGRGEEKTFRYRSPSPVVSATVDPDRVLLLDLNQTNNSRTLAPKNGAAASTWALRYFIWLEDLLLSYSSLA